MAGQNIATYILENKHSWSNGNYNRRSYYYPIIAAYLKAHPATSNEVADALDIDLHKVQSAMYRMRQHGMIERVWRLK